MVRFFVHVKSFYDADRQVLHHRRSHANAFLHMLHKKKLAFPFRVFLVWYRLQK